MHIFTKSALFVYGAMKLGLIGFFVFTINQANPASAAQEPVCEGRDLMVELAKSDPATLDNLRQQAAKTIYGDARLWKLSKPGIADSWLFGTMHMADDKVSVLPEPALAAFNRADKVLVEITDMIDPQKARANIAKLQHLTFRLDGTTIESDLSGDQLNLLKAAIKARELPYALAIRMQPWMLAPVISNQLCELTAKKNGKRFLDAKIMKMAIDDQKQLIALETSEEQLSAIASMPYKFQLTMLVETLGLGNKLDNIKETMKALYAEGKISMIVPLVRHYSAKYTGKSTGEVEREQGFDEFQQKLVVQRNLNMAARAAQHFARGRVFMAVGALHLPGNDGLVALLEKQGFAVDAIATPYITN